MKIPAGMAIGCGITAVNLFDAMNILKEQVFVSEEIPPIIKSLENVDITTLDPNHILPNMGAPNRRGVWFPLGFQE